MDSVMLLWFSVVIRVFLSILFRFVYRFSLSQHNPQHHSNRIHNRISEEMLHSLHSLPLRHAVTEWTSHGVFIFAMLSFSDNVLSRVGLPHAATRPTREPIRLPYPFRITLSQYLDHSHTSSSSEPSQVSLPRESIRFRGAEFRRIHDPLIPFPEIIPDIIAERISNDVHHVKLALDELQLAIHPDMRGRHELRKRFRRLFFFGQWEPSPISQ